jgi:hypothetical protein
VGDAAPHDVLGREAVDPLAGQRDLALGADHVADRAQGRRLAGAVGAEQGRDRPFGKAEADAVQDPRQAVAGLKVHDVEQRRGHQAAVPR